MANTKISALTDGSPAGDADAIVIARGGANYKLNVGTIGAGAMFNAKAYGAKGDGTTDDTSSIQAAINAAGAAGGGIVYLPHGTYKTTSTLVIGNASGGSNSTYQGVVLRGEGRQAVDAFGNSTTKIQWAGSSAGTIVQINGPIGGWGVQCLQINGGGGGAAIGLQVISGQSGLVHDVLIDACTKGIATTTISGGTHGTSFNHWIDVSVYVHSVTSSAGIYLDGNSDALSNTCYDLFDHIYINYVLAGTTPTGIYLNRCDNIRMRSLLFANSGSKNAITFDYSGHSGWPSDCVIEQVDFGSATATVVNVGTPPLTNGGANLANRISYIAQTNGRPVDPALLGLEFGNWNYGTATITFPGGSTQSGIPAVPHSLGVAPKGASVVVAGYSGVNVCPAVEVASAFNDATNICFRASTIDGQTPLNTATVTVWWMARG